MVSGRSIKTSRGVVRSGIFNEPSFIDKRVSAMKEKDLRQSRGGNPIVSPTGNGTHRIIYHRKNIDDYPDPSLPTKEQEMQA